MDAGKMRILLVDPKKATHPEIPTLMELGYPLDRSSPGKLVYK
jgi:hypothetical protein